MNLFDNLQLMKNNSHILQEMATIGSPKNGYSVSIYDSEGSKPHLHFVNNEGKRKAKGKGVVNVPIRLDKAEYFHHGKYTSYLTNEQKEIMIAILNEKPNNPKSIYKNNYQVAIARWNEANNYWNEDSINYLSVDTNMPDFTILECKR